MEAETVSFLICHHVGLISPSPEYLAGYIDDETDWLDFSYETVIKVADRLQGLLLPSSATLTKDSENLTNEDDRAAVRAYEIVQKYLDAGVVSFISICNDIHRQHGIETLHYLFKHLKGAYSAAQTLMEEDLYINTDKNIRSLTVADIIAVKKEG
jgi:hypothetical protein